MIWWNFPADSILFGYQHELQQWSTIIGTYNWIMTLLPVAANNLDGSLANLDMDNTVAPDLGNVNLDTLGSSTGTETLAAFTSANILNTFDTDTAFMTGILTPADFTTGERSVLQNVRPYFDDDSVDATINLIVQSKSTPGGEFSVATKARAVNRIGLIPYRLGGRFYRATFFTTGNVKQLRGFDFAVAGAGRR
jgi:hypothetical protein